MLLFCYHADRSQRYRPKITGSSVRPGGSAGLTADYRLTAKAQALDQRAVPADVGAAQVAKQPTAAADKQQQAAAAVVIVLMHLEVLVQVVDPAGHQRDLDFRRTGVTLTDRVIRKDLLLNFGIERHVTP
jgi:hypothetical protein